MKQAMRDMSDKAFKSVCMWMVVISPAFLPPSPSTTSAVKTPENTDDPGDWTSRWTYPLISCVQPKYMSCKQKFPVRTLVSIGTIWWSRIFSTSESAWSHAIGLMAFCYNYTWCNKDNEQLNFACHNNHKCFLSLALWDLGIIATSVCLYKFIQGIIIQDNDESYWLHAVVWLNLS